MMYVLRKNLALILLLLCGGLTAYGQDIVAIEYFFDTDPGYGSATGITISSPTPDVNLTDEVLTTASSLPLGFHILYMRAQTDSRVIVTLDSTHTIFDGDAIDSAYFSYDTLTNWGLAESRLVFVDATGAVTIEIDTLEYFFDTDPGYGNGAPISATASNFLELMRVISTDTLSPGFHNLFLRARTTAGEWGQAESRLVLVQAGDVGQAVLIDRIEYFFDNDPGYGNGIAIDISTPSNEIALPDTLMADTLGTGFHVLYVRARGEGGKWGQAQSSLVFVDQSGSISSVNITELEYFFDIDPGYDAGTPLFITPGDPNPFRNINLAASGLSEGLHYVFVRAKDENGQWGMAESKRFAVYGPGRQLDSASLVVMYNQLDGPNWTNRANWLSGALDTWFGVEVVGTRVDSVELSNNNLSGEVPKEVSYILNLKKLDLSRNHLIDTIPSQITDLTLLKTLALHDNQLHELPNVAAITGLNTVTLDTNYFDFGDLEALAAIPNLSYSNQKVYDDFPIDTIAKIGNGFTLNKTVEGNSNLFQWFLNGDSIFLADVEDLTIPSFQATDTGIYVLKVRNDIITDLELQTTDFHIGISDFEEDSLALVSLYSKTGGATWTTATNWLTGNLNTWSGVTVANDRVTGLALPGNNLAGKIPTDFSYADSVVNIDLSGNLITDTLPDTWRGFSSTVSINVSNNDLVKIPNLNQLTVTGELTTFNIAGNRIQPGDMEPNISISNFTYAPQDTLTASRDTLFDANTDPAMTFAVTGANNSYLWFKNTTSLNGVAGFTGATTNTLTIANAQFEDEGDYILRITNASLPGLTLYSGKQVVGITSLLRDSAALAALYQATGGPNWTSANNWTTGTIDTWQGVTLNNAQDRVIGLSLPGNNLQNILPARIRDITSMETVDLSDNELTSLPNLTVMPNITSFDISENRIGMAELEVNQSLTGIVFDPQKNIGTASTQKAEFGSDVTLTTVVSGNSNEYQWYRNGVMIEGATSSAYTIPAIDFSKMGDYHSVVTSPNIPDFSLERSTATVLATTTLSGVVTDPDDLPLPDGDAILYGVVQQGPYDSLSLSELGADGSYSFDEVVLGDYLVLTRPDRTQDPDYIQTYFGNSIFWENADTIELRQPGTSYDVQMTGPPTAPPPGTNEVLGTVELEFLEEGTGRALARRKVQRAGCSMRRLRTAGRTLAEDDDYELIAYVESNDEGAFDFGEVPPGQYRFNIQYPGIPMDENSFVEFTLEEEETLILSALITEFGISVSRVPLGVRPSIMEFRLYPNPVRDKAVMEYRIKRKVNAATLKIWTTSGQLVQELQAPSSRGSQSVTIDVSEWLNGVYFIVLQTDLSDVVIHSKLVVEKE